MWRVFIAWAQAHMLWHMASRPDADPPGAACPWNSPPRPLRSAIWLERHAVTNILVLS